MIKVMTFNANGIRAATRKGFWDWFASQEIDFLCIQETKAQFYQLEKDAIYFPQGYHYYYKDAIKKGYSGVAIYAKKKPLNIKTNLDIDFADNEGRYIQCDYKNFSIASIYFPSGSSGEERHNFKMRFLEEYQEVLKDQINQNRDFIICGDVNIVHREIDIKNWKPNYKKTSGVLPKERAWLDYIFNELGWVDSFRVINQESNNYTWWSNRGQARANNVGWRIDYQIISKKLKNKVVPNSDSIYREKWYSDHAPLTIAYDYDV